MTSTTESTLPTGPAAASLIAAGLGLLALAISHVLSEVSAPVKDSMQALGNLWVPGAEGLGPYSGKEIVALLTWVVGWVVLHACMKKRDANLITAGLITLALIGAATTILWPPITHLFVHQA